MNKLNEGLRQLGWVPELQKNGVRHWRNEDYPAFLIKQRATNNYAVHRNDLRGPMKYATSGDEAHAFVADQKPTVQPMREWINLAVMMEQTAISKKQIDLKELRRLIGAGRRRWGFFDLYTVNGYRPNVTPLAYNGQPIRTVLIQNWANANILWQVIFIGDHGQQLAQFHKEPFEIDAKPVQASDET